MQNPAESLRSSRLTKRPHSSLEDTPDLGQPQSKRPRAEFQHGDTLRGYVGEHSHGGATVSSDPSSAHQDGGAEYMLALQLQTSIGQYFGGLLTDTHRSSGQYGSVSQPGQDLGHSQSQLLNMADVRGKLIVKIMVTCHP